MANRYRLSSDAKLIVTIVLAVAAWIFSAGMLWQKVNDVETDVRDIKTALMQGKQIQSQKTGEDNVNVTATSY